MSRLTELLRSCITVIVRYHQQVSSNVEGLEVEKIDLLLTRTKEQMQQELLHLVMASTETVQTRRPLLQYICYAIDLLRALKDSDTTFFEANAKQTAAELQTLFISLKTLLTTSQQRVVLIKYKDICIEIYGLINGVWPVCSLCTSGRVIESTLFPALRLRPAEADAERIQLALDDLLNEHALSLKLKDSQEALEHARRLIPAAQRAQLGPIVVQPLVKTVLSHEFTNVMHPQRPPAQSFMSSLFPFSRPKTPTPIDLKEPRLQGSGSFLND
jgi:hypothetical protein